MRAFPKLTHLPRKEPSDSRSKYLNNFCQQPTGVQPQAARPELSTTPQGHAKFEAAESNLARTDPHLNLYNANQNLFFKGTGNPTEGSG